MRTFETLKLGLVLLFAVSCATTQKKKDDELADEPNKETMSKDIAIVKADDPAVRAFQEEVAYLQKGKIDFEDVEDRMGGLTRKHPHYALPWYNLGVAQEAQGKIKEAEQSYRQAVTLNPALREAQENLAALAAKKGDPGEAASLLRELVSRDPGAATARIALAQQSLAAGDVDEAVVLCQDALGHQPKNIGAYCVLAQAAVKQKDFQRARLLAAQGLKIDKSGGCLHNVVGQVALEEGNTGAALVAFETAVQNNPRLLDARFRIAQISMGFKDFKKAIDNYISITQVDPKNAAAFVNLGIALKGSGRFPEAEKAYLQAIEVGGTSPSAASAHYNLGVLYFRDLKRIDDAQTHLKRVLQVGDGDDGEVFKMLEEIEQMKQLAEEEKRMEVEAKQQEEIEKKAAEDEALQKKRDEEINKRMEAEEKSRGKAEPGSPEEDDTPPIESESKPKPAPKKKAAPKKEKKQEPQEPVGPDDFE
jgi:tetratricopeptide (TPR) repeat protein